MLKFRKILKNSRAGKYALLVQQHIADIIKNKEQRVQKEYMCFLKTNEKV